MNEVIRINGARNLTGRGRSAIYRDIKSGLMPRPFKLGKRSSGWYRSELEAVTAARAAGKTDDQIRDLVKQIEGERARGAG